MKCCVAPKHSSAPQAAHAAANARADEIILTKWPPLHTCILSLYVCIFQTPWEPPCPDATSALIKDQPDAPAGGPKQGQHLPTSAATRGCLSRTSHLVACWHALQGPLARGQGCERPHERVKWVQGLASRRAPALRLSSRPRHQWLRATAGNAMPRLSSLSAVQVFWRVCGE